MKKTAVVIGVNSTGELPVLRAAALGAQSFGAWLAGEGFEVSYFVDENEPVTVKNITDHITALIDQGPPEQLILYFAGHGFLNNYSEFWMLSEAPRNVNEAISVRESIELARECGIANVVMISDACRSTPQSLHAERVRGSLIFPSETVSRHTRPEIDRFFAALPGEPALETVLDKSVQQYEGIFTHCFLDAYQRPDAEMVRKLTFNGGFLEVVPNRNLKEYLRRQVPALMSDRGFMVQQIPDAIVESGDQVYLGQVRMPLASERSFGVRIPPKRAVFGVRDVARLSVSDALGHGDVIPSSDRAAIATTAIETGFDASVELVEAAQRRGREHFETRSGFSVLGARVSEAVGLDMPAELFSRGDGAQPAYIRLHPGEAGIVGQSHVSSVILRFADGSGTVLAGLTDYIGTVAVDQGRVVNVSYVPSDNSYRWGEYQEAGPRLERLRATVAAAAKYGTFRVDKQNAMAVAGQIRYMKSIDPTLGLYAAYAYAEVGMSAEVESVMDYMQGDLDARLFDVAMLAGALAGDRSRPGVVPFCPLLSQGWNLLRVKRAGIPAAAEAAADHLLPALWTTFASAGMDLIFRALDQRTLPSSSS